ncbi:LuxR C-terminal-related transcriptional regulator [Actinokineospora sp.]|uniref:LuxR C-terminal-related transcriptional regulator n=1 Tax=Actinokineospora sp. TaxID=1872133 RepID=UPI004037DB66
MPADLVLTAAVERVRFGSTDLPRRRTAADRGDRLVGRVRELAALDRALGGGLLEIIGEPGIGKTRLLAELAARAEGTVLRARATPATARTPFHLFVAALDDHLRTVSPRLPSAMVDALAPVFPALRGRGAVAWDSRGHIDHDRVLPALVALLDAPENRHLVVLLDDVHHADPGSIEVLENLSPTGGLLVAVAYRPRQAPARLRSRLAVGVEQGTVARIELGPLSAGEAADLLGEPADAVYQESGGNPLYLKMLAAGVRPTAGLEALVFAELAVLSPREWTAAAAAAVLGERFDVAGIVEVAGLDHEEAAVAVTALLALDLVRPVDAGPRLALRHPVLGRVVAERADPLWRVGAHCRAYERATLAGAGAAERARHVVRFASTWNPAHFTVLREAAASASPVDAAHWLRAAVELLPASADFAAARAETTYLLGRALGLAGQVVESRDLLHDLLPTVPAGLSALYSAAVALCGRMERLLGHYREAAALLRREIAHRPAEVSAEAVAVRVELGTTALLAGDYAAARADVARALVVARALGDPAAAAGVLALQAFGETYHGCTADAGDLADAAAAAVDGLSDAALAGDCELLSRLGWAELFLERFADAERHLARGAALARRRGEHHTLAHLLLGLGQVNVLRGRGAAGQEYARQAERTADLVGGDDIRAFAAALKVLATMGSTDSGDVVATRALATRAATATGPASGCWSRTVHLVAGLTALVAGDPNTCRSTLLRIGGGPELPLVQPSVRPRYLEVLAMAMLATGDLDSAEAASRTARDAALGLALAGQRACATRAAAVVLGARGDLWAAAELFAEAAAGFAAAGMVLDEAQTYLRAAPVLLACGRADEAAALLDRAAVTGLRVGVGWLRDAARLARTVVPIAAADPGPPGPPSVSLGAARTAVLTSRELEVARMVGTGRTSQQIARHLGISARTVETHLTHIYRKLGVPSRSALASLIERTADAPVVPLRLVADR